jgi:hypothetical protein
MAAVLKTAWVYTLVSSNLTTSARFYLKLNKYLNILFKIFNMKTSTKLNLNTIIVGVCVALMVVVLVLIINSIVSKQDDASNSSQSSSTVSSSQSSSSQISSLSNSEPTKPENTPIPQVLPTPQQ